MPRIVPISIVIAVVAFCTALPVEAGVAQSAIRETSEFIFKKFGKGLAGESAEQIAARTTRVIAKHGDECLPLLRSAGHAGFRALEEAGEHAPDVLRLYAKHGDGAIWLLSD